MTIACPKCQRNLQATEASLGMKIQCQWCGSVFESSLPEVAVVNENSTMTVSLTFSTQQHREQLIPQTSIMLQVQIDAGQPQPISLPRSFPEPKSLPQVVSVPKALPEPKKHILPQILQQPVQTTNHIRTDAPLRKTPGIDEPVGWFVKTKEGEVGPLHIIQVAKAVGMGRIGPGTPLRHNGKNITVFACCVPGLFPPSVYNPLLKQLEKEEKSITEQEPHDFQDLMAESLAELKAANDDDSGPLEARVQAQLARESAA